MLQKIEKFLEQEMVAGEVNCLQAQVLIVKKDLYLLMCHPNVGNALYNQFHKEASLAMIDLKVEDPNIDKADREVEADKKVSVSIKKKHNNTSRGRGCGHASHSKHYMDRVHDQYGRGVFNHREHFSNDGSFHNTVVNRHRDSYNDYRGGRGEYYPGNFNGNFQNNQVGNGNFGQGLQNGPNNSHTRILGWIPQG